MYALRVWATRRARALEILYALTERAALVLAPLWSGIGRGRLERPAAALEAWLKGALFDCRMCGQCVLSATGMTCPMTCPKFMRNGPCGGVRETGDCEIDPRMRCVWVEAWAGSLRMRGGMAIMAVQDPVDHRLAGSSAWVRLLSEADPTIPADDQGRVR